MSHPRDMTPNEAQGLLQRDPSITYVDVRSTAEYTNGHVPGSINIPLAELDPARGMAPNPDFMAVMTKLFSADRCLILGCASGGRSRQAAAILAAEGFTNLISMAGGFSGQRGPGGIVPGWKELGLPVSTDGTSYAAAKTRAGM